MKRICLGFFPLLYLVACSFPSAAPQEDVPTEGGQYRYISFSGTIETMIKTDNMGDFAGKAFEYGGDYQVELWFPMEGGQAVQQRNTIVLSDFRDLYFGEDPCAPCDWQLDESVYTPVPFELQADLELNAMTEGGETVDALSYQLMDIPMVTITGTVLCPCEHAVPGPINDPAGYPQLLSWFSHKWVDPVKLNSVENTSFDPIALSPLYDIFVPEQNLSYVLVPDLDTP